MRRARPICFKPLTQLIRWALDFALASAGRSNPARMAIMAITTSSSMSVKAFDFDLNVNFIAIVNGNEFVYIKFVRSVNTIFLAAAMPASFHAISSASHAAKTVL